MRPSIVSLSSRFLTLTHRSYVSLVIRPALRRASHQSAVSRFKESSTDVPIGNNGHITVSILQPVTSRGDGSDARSKNVILYLPSGPLFTPSATSVQSASRDDTSKPSETPQRALASASLATVVTVNYRLDRDTADDSSSDKIAHKYPTPVHDTLQGFDWIFQHLNPSQLCVYGARIGGSLAVMLGLTEPRSIRAVAAMEPMCDWVGLDDYCQMVPESENVWCRSQSSDSGDPNPPSSNTGGQRTSGSDESSLTDSTTHQGQRKRGRKKKPPPPDLVPLLESRNKLFRKPANYFDPFASPTLFLRSSGKECPNSFLTYLTGPEYPVPVLQRPPSTPEDDELYFNLFAADPDIDLLSEDIESSQAARNKNVRRRKTLSRWPPHGLDYGLESYGLRTGAPLSDKLVLPDVRIFVQSGLADDDVEDQLMSRSIQTGTNHDEQPPAAETPAETRTEPDAETASEPDTAHSSKDDEETGETRRASRGSLADVSKSTTGETVLARQGAEMVSLMHHACFWGHPAGFGQDRVRIVRVPRSAEHAAEEVSSSPSLDASGTQAPSTKDNVATVAERGAGKWFRSVFQEGDDGKETQL